MSTKVKWWGNSSSAVDAEPPASIPFPTRRARMMLRPPHQTPEEQVTEENMRAADFAANALSAVEDVSRKMNILARELHCLVYDEDDGDGDDYDPPTAA